VRHTGGRARAERAWLFIPDDHRLRRWADTIAEQRRHSLRRDDDQREQDPVDPAALDEPPVDDVGQLSLFGVLSAQVVGAEGGASAFDDDDDVDADLLDGDDHDGGVAVELPTPPAPGGGGDALPAELAGRPLAEVKARLRAVNAGLAGELARFTGLPHREVNGRLNRLASVERIADATVDQLRRRAAHAERWMASL
jgi:hypothetical protein